MSTSRDSSGDFRDVMAHEELAANLIKCAVLVKKGDKDPLIRQTIHDLTYYFTGRRVTTTTTTTTISSSSSQAAHSSPNSISKHQHMSLNGVLGKLGIHQNDDSATALSVKSASEKAATSQKNAERVKTELLRGAGLAAKAATSEQSPSQEWCDVHFTRNCHCQKKVAAPVPAAKPPFQRPSNPKSALIANGWIEQQRRSKFRPVWKEVLASLVEGRKPGEETTLWIQREVTNAGTGKIELEALHQIPVKWLQDVTYSNYSPDRRFILKVYDMPEEFVFRCEASEEAAQNWVLTLRSMQEISRGKKAAKTGLDDWDKPLPSGGGGKESSSSFEDEKKAPDRPPQTLAAAAPHRLNVAHATPQAAIAAQQQQQAAAMMAQQQQQQSARQHAAHQQPGAQKPDPPPTSAAAAAVHAVEAPIQMSVKELRAIAHGAGLTTYGMERRDLELVVQQITAAASRGPPPPTAHRPPPPPVAPAASNTPSPPTSSHSLNGGASAEEDARRKQQGAEEMARRQKLAEDEAKNRAVAAALQKAEDEKRKAMTEQMLRQQQEADKIKKDEEERLRLEGERRRREEEEHRRRVADLQAAEQRRRQEEQQRVQQAQWQQQQQNWQKQQEEDELRRRADEQRTAEERRRQDEAYRAQHQQWQQQQQQQSAGVPPKQWQQQQQMPPSQQPPPHGQRPPFVQGHASPPPNGGHPPPPPPPIGSSPMNMKYAKMASQTGDGGQLALQAIKHGILVEWALQPPTMQILRPIEVLLTSIHTVFPPRFGVAAHEHFTKWTVVAMPEVMSGAQPDNEKLKKVVRKLRFLLHPDKLPRDLSNEQTHICKMLWDITTDAFEDHKKKEEELGWMR